MSSFYVASRFTKQERVRAVMDRLVAAGHTITFDWSRNEHQFDEKGDQFIYGQDMDVATQQHLAYKDATGAMSCDALILLVEDGMIGSWIEMGMALGNDRFVYVVGEPRYCIFWALPNVCFVRDEEELFRELKC